MVDTELKGKIPKVIKLISDCLVNSRTRMSSQLVKYWLSMAMPQVRYLVSTYRMAMVPMAGRVFYTGFC